jgi:rod shape determining protein RodA
MLANIRKVDWSIILILLLFAGISTMVVFSATYGDSQYSNYHIKNLINYALGFLGLIGAAVVNYRILLKSAFYIYIFGIVLLVAVYFYGDVYNSARGWFSLPLGFNFQPAELVKLILIITVARFISRRDGEQLELLRDVIPIGFIVFIPFALVLIQPDLGNAIIYIVILLGMLWIGNVKYVHVLIGTALVALSMVLFFYLFNTYHEPIESYLMQKGKGHWVERIDTFIDPENASADASYQVNNSIRAIGSGGLTGDKYLQGNSVHNNFIPYAYSDSIFVVIGEEFGFIGSSMLLLLYFLLIYRMILIAIHSKDRSGSFMIIGIVSMFVFQIFENIGMLIGIMPLTGITLPFVSYGGSSLLINMISIGIVLSIQVHEEPTPEY